MYYAKYLKYKTKYFNLKNKIQIYGGVNNNDSVIDNEKIKKIVDSVKDDKTKSQSIRFDLFNYDEQKIILSDITKDESALQYIDFCSCYYYNIREILLPLIKKKPDLIKLIKLNTIFNCFVKNEIILTAINSNPTLIDNLSHTINKRCIYENFIEKKDMNIYPYIIVFQQVNNDEEKVFNMVKEYGLNLEYASDTLKNNIDIVLAAINQDGNSLIYADQQFKKNKEFILTALKNKLYYYDFISDDISKDKDFILNAYVIVKSFKHWDDCSVIFRQKLIKYIQKYFTFDILLEAIQLNIMQICNIIHEYCEIFDKIDQNNIQLLIIEAIKINKNEFNNIMQTEFYKTYIENNKEFQKKIIENCGSAINTFLEHKSDKDIALKAVINDPEILSSITIFNKNQDFLLDAIKQNHNVITQIKDEMITAIKEDNGFTLINSDLNHYFDFIKKAIEINNNVLKLLHFNNVDIYKRILSHNETYITCILYEDIVLKLVTENPKLIEFVNPLYKNMIFYLKAIKCNNTILNYLSDEMKESKYIKKFANIKHNTNYSNNELYGFEIVNNKQLVNDKFDMIIKTYQDKNTYQYATDNIKNDKDLLLVYNNYIPRPLLNETGICYFNTAVQMFMCINEFRNEVFRSHYFENEIHTGYIKNLYSYLNKKLNKSLSLCDLRDSTEILKDITVDTHEDSLDLYNEKGGIINVIIEDVFLKNPLIKELFFDGKIIPICELNRFELIRSNKKYVCIEFNNVNKYRDITGYKIKAISIRTIINSTGHIYTYVNTIGNIWYLCDNLESIEINSIEEEIKKLQSTINTYIKIVIYEKE